MTQRKKRQTKPRNRLDTYSAEDKKRRGRPQRVRPSEVYGRALNYRATFGLVWDRLAEPLLKCTSQEDVAPVFERYAAAYAREFVPALAGLILKTVHHARFPKRREPQIRYLADSLAAYGRVTAKRSREIVAKELAMEKAKLQHRVLRREFYIVCSCGYEGPTYKRDCPRRHPGQGKLEISEILPARFF
jgi:hypothetical protein